MTKVNKKTRAMVNEHGDLTTEGRRELQQLLNMLLDGELDSDQKAMFEQLLQQSEQARSEYIQFSNLHAGLGYAAQNSSLDSAGSLRDQAIGAGTSKSDSDSASGIADTLQAVVGTFSLAKHWAQSHRRLAATVMLSVAASGVFVFFQREVAERGLDRNRVQYAARIVDGAGCVWGNAVGSVAFDGLLRSSETLELEEGLAKLRFESGAEVVIKGPANLFIESGMICRLDQGELTANVPRIARGFTVQTPLGRVVDLGTAFGVNVGNDVDLQVFEGEIEVYPGSGSGQTVRKASSGDKPIGLSSGATRKLQVNEDSSVVNLVTLGGPGYLFTRSLPDVDDPTARKPTVLAVDSFGQGSSGSRLLGRNGGFGWSGGWTDEGVDCNSASFAVGVDGVTSRGSGDGAIQRHLSEEFTKEKALFFSAEFQVDGPDEVCSAWLEVFKYDTDRWSNGELDLVTIGITDGMFSGRMAPWGTKSEEKLIGDCGRYTPGTRHLVVGKIEFNADGEKERLSVWINPSLAQEPYPDRVILKDTGWEFANAVAIRCWEMDDSTSATVDEVRVGKTWMSVVQ